MVKNLIKAFIILAALTSTCFANKNSPYSYAQEITTDSSKNVINIFMPEDNWFLSAGQEIKATIQNAIFSFNLQTPIIAIVDEPAVCLKNGLIILPKKTRLLGTAEVLKSDDRVNIRFNIAVLPNGREFEINGIALSPDGSAGIKGEVKEYKDIRLMSSALGGAMSGIGQAMVATLPGQPIVSGAIGGALTQGAQEAQTISNQKADVSISVPPFQKTLVFLSQRLSLDKHLTNKQPVNKEKDQDEEKPKDWKKE
ncbi:MAG: TrbI/VirB10 family protein [Elusimicrobia bacterium]|nr:TrbI/VirB10 family protein [Elusimicrobiota bacterium]